MSAPGTPKKEKSSRKSAADKAYRAEREQKGIKQLNLDCPEPYRKAVRALLRELRELYLKNPQGQAGPEPEPSAADALALASMLAGASAAASFDNSHKLAALEESIRCGKILLIEAPAACDDKMADILEYVRKFQRLPPAAHFVPPAFLRTAKYGLLFKKAVALNQVADLENALKNNKEPYFDAASGKILFK